MSTTLVNKAAQRDVVILDLEKLYPITAELAVIDLKDFLFKELLLKEKDFRASLETISWEQYAAKNVLVHCSSQAIIPMWAYMLVSSYLVLQQANIFYTESSFKEDVLIEKIKRLSIQEYTAQRVLVKGCGKYALSPKVYIALTAFLTPIVKSVAFGEVCSSVPVFKR